MLFISYLFPNTGILFFLDQCKKNRDIFLILKATAHCYWVFLYIEIGSKLKEKFVEYFLLDTFEYVHCLISNKLVLSVYMVDCLSYFC